MPGPPRWPLLVFSGRGVHLPQLVIHSKNTESQILKLVSVATRMAEGGGATRWFPPRGWPGFLGQSKHRLSRMTGNPAPPSQDTRDQVTGNLTRTCLPQTAAGAETWKETCVPAVFFLVLGCVSRPMKGLGERAGGWGGGSQALFSTSLDVCLFPNKCVL